MNGWLFAYLYLAGMGNGVLIIALDEEANGDWPPVYKMILATALWPLLFPYLYVGALIKRAFSR